MQTEDLKGGKPWWQGALVIITNLSLLAVYNVYLFHAKGDITILILYAFGMTVQIAVCLIISVFAFRKEFIVSAILVLLIGFSTCYMGV